MNINPSSSKPHNLTKNYFSNSSLITAGFFAAILVTTGTLDQVSPFIIFFSLIVAFLIVKLRIVNVFVDIREKYKKALLENYTFTF